MVPGGGAAGPRGTSRWVSSSLQQPLVQPLGAQGRPCWHRPILPRWLSARGMTRLLTPHQVLGVAQRGPAAGSGQGVLVTERGAARWNGLPACRPLILAPCCRDHVLPARRPTAAAHILTMMKSRRLPRCPPTPAPAPPGLHEPPRSPCSSSTGWDRWGSAPHGTPSPAGPAMLRGRVGEGRQALGLCVGWAAYKRCF